MKSTGRSRIHAAERMTVALQERWRNLVAELPVTTDIETSHSMAVDIYTAHNHAVACARREGLHHPKPIRYLVQLQRLCRRVYQLQFVFRD